MITPIKDPLWIVTAKKYIGLKEIPGKVNNQTIVKMFERIKFGKTSDETPWCAAFVGDCLEENLIVSTRAAWALGYKTYGQSCPMAYGSIAVMERRNSAGKIIGGHVTFVVGRRLDGMIMCLGGNQGDRVSIAPFPRSRIVATRYPLAFVPPVAELPVYAMDGKITPTKLV